jgi:hypothetical protein
MKICMTRQMSCCPSLNFDSVHFSLFRFLLPASSFSFTSPTVNHSFNGFFFYHDLFKFIAKEEAEEEEEEEGKRKKSNLLSLFECNYVFMSATIPCNAIRIAYVYTETDVIHALASPTINFIQQS